MKIQVKGSSCTYLRQGNDLQIREESSSFAFLSRGTGKEHVEDTCLGTLVEIGAWLEITRLAHKARVFGTKYNVTAALASV